MQLPSSVAWLPIPLPSATVTIGRPVPSALTPNALNYMADVLTRMANTAANTSLVGSIRWSAIPPILVASTADLGFNASRFQVEMCLVGSPGIPTANITFSGQNGTRCAAQTNMDRVCQSAKRRGGARVVWIEYVSRFDLVSRRWMCVPVTALNTSSLGVCADSAGSCFACVGSFSMASSGIFNIHDQLVSFLPSGEKRKKRKN